MNLSLEEISQAIDGVLEGPGHVNVRGYSIDSRTINAGELFFAIKGPRFDGHEFVAQALQKGAAAAVVEEELRPSPAPPPAASPPPSAKGQIRQVALIAEANEGVGTNGNPVHLEFFKAIDEIAEAKAELIEGLHEPKVAYLNNDDPRVRAMARNFAGKVITYGVKSVARFKVQQIQDLGIEGTAFTVQHGQGDAHFVLPLLGQHNVANAIAAIAVGVTHEVPWEQIREAISQIKPEKKRGEVVKFREGFVAIDDSYNSNPRALSEMIPFLGRLQGYQRKILVAGEMLELGPEGPELHRNCGREAARAGLEMIICVQGQAKEILEGALDSGMDRFRLKFVGEVL